MTPPGVAFGRLVHVVGQTTAGGRPGGDGRVAVRAFYGRYDVTVSWRGRTRTVSVDHVPGDRPTVVRVEF